MAMPSPGLQQNPEHKIVVTPYRGPVTVRFRETVIASTENALELREASYPPVLYIPFEDIYFEHLRKSDTHTHCPFKGDASYWGVTAQNEAEPDVMWAYEAPYAEMIEIRNHGAFYPDKVSIETA